MRDVFQQYAPTIRQRAAVRWRAEAVDAKSGLTVRAHPWRRNMITDYGLDRVGVAYWMNAWLLAVAGTGASVTKRDSGAVTFTCAGNAVSTSGGFFVAQDVGRILKLDTGEERYLTVYSDAQNMTFGGAALAAGPTQGTIHYVNSPTLATETKRTSTLGSDSGDNFATFARPTWTNQRTFLFSVEAAPVTYTEIGWSHTATVGANLFGRDVISGGIAVGIGQQLKVIVQVLITISPDTSSAWVNPAHGWTQNGVHCCEGADAVSHVVSPGGGMTGGNLDPYDPNNSRGVLCTDSTALVSSTITPGNYAGGLLYKNTTVNAYTNGTFTRTKEVTFALSESNSTLIRTIGYEGASPSRRGYSVLLNAVETKDGSHTVRLVWTWAWGRTLVN